MSTTGKVRALRVAAPRNADVLTEGYMCNCQVPALLLNDALRSTC